MTAMAKIYGGMPYLGSLPDSPAERAGLRWGDIVLAVNGMPTPDGDAFIAARQLRQGGATVRFVRDGREQEVELCW
jgi:S1-C subfamily serine protease